MSWDRRVRGSLTWAGVFGLAAALAGGCGNKGDGSSGDGDGDGDGDLGGAGPGDGDGDAGGDGDLPGDGDGDLGGAGGGDGDSSTSTQCLIEDPAESVELPGWQSGSRLVARVVRAPGMPDTFVGFFDSELGVPCSFEVATDGELRCLPHDLYGYSLFGYADDGCSERIFDAPEDCATQNAFVKMETGSCGEREVRKLEPLGTNFDYFVGQPGDCSAGTAPIDPGDGEFFGLSAPMAPSEFVVGTFSSEPGACLSRVRVIEGEDGSRAPLTIEAAVADAACRLSEGDDDTSRCAPVLAALLNTGLIFSDAECTEELRLADTATPAECGAPEIIREGGGRLLYQLGEVFEGEAYSNPGCAPARDQAWIGELYEVGDPIEEDEFPHLTRTAVGTGRLQSYVFGEEDVALVFGATGTNDWIFYDTELETPCAVRLFDDGVYRCVPAPLRVADFYGGDYLDADCTEAIVRCDMCDGVGFSDQIPNPTACLTHSTSSQVLRATTEIGEVNEFFTGDAESCGAASTFGGPSAWQAEEIDLETLAVVQVVEE